MSTYLRTVTVETSPVDSSTTSSLRWRCSARMVSSSSRALLRKVFMRLHSMVTRSITGPYPRLVQQARLQHDPLSLAAIAHSGASSARASAAKCAIFEAGTPLSHASLAPAMPSSQARWSSF